MVNSWMFRKGWVRSCGSNGCKGGRGHKKLPAMEDDGEIQVDEATELYSTGCPTEVVNIYRT